MPVPYAISEAARHAGRGYLNVSAAECKAKGGRRPLAGSEADPARG